MSIKITKPGKLPAEKPYAGSCTNCGCHITCKRKDGEYIDDQRDGDCLKVRCPTDGCSSFIYAIEQR